MKEVLVSVLRSKAFKAALLALAAAVTAWASNGCSLLAAADPKAAHALTVLECKVAVLEPYVGDMAEQLVQSVDGNRAFDMVSFLRSQGLGPREILDLAERFRACEGPVDPEPEPLHAPAYQQL